MRIQIRSALSRARASVESVAWDVWHGVNTRGVTKPEQENCWRYEPTDIGPTFWRSLAMIDRPEETTFIDIGSGKGRIVLMAARLPFRAVVGVEYSRELHETAERNLKQARFLPRSCRDVRLVCTDAREYRFPEGRLAIYLYNPFREPILRQVLGQLAGRSDQLTIITMGSWTPTAPIIELCGPVAAEYVPHRVYRSRSQAAWQAAG
jgi:SAM-dependent methyltransferase